MNLRRIKHMLFRLSIEEKVLGLGCLSILVSAFMPWYSMSLTINESTLNETGFSGDLGVVGFVIFLIATTSLMFLISEHLHIKLPNFGYKKDQIILFLMGQNAFLVLLTIAIYTKRSLLYTNAELRFGLYMALIGACMGAFAGFAQIQKTQKKDTKAFFDHSEEEIEETASDDDVNTGHGASRNDDEEIKYAVGTSRNLSNENKVNNKTHKSISQNDQKNFFYENSDEDSIDDSTEEPIYEPDTVEEISDDDTVKTYHDVIQDDDIDDEPISEPDAVEEEIDDNAVENIEEIIETPTIDTVETSDDATGINHDLSDDEIIDNETEIKKEPSAQGDYFMRDAGVEEKKSNIKVDIDSIKSVEKTENKSIKPTNQTMSFYDDL